MSKKCKFRISASVESYDNKKVAKDCVSNGETVREGKRAVTKFREMEICVDEFVELATTGHTFCGLFKHKKVNFTAKTKTAKNYRGSQCVFVDIDDTRYETMDDFIDVLSYPPTVGYYSFNDCAEGKGRRFRLVYVLDDVYDWETVRQVYINIKTQTEYDTDEKIKDNCGGSPEQCFFGTCYKDVWKGVNNIYTPEDIELVGCEIEPQEGQKQAIRELIPTIDKDFIRDIKKMSYKQFIYNYYHIKGYLNFWQTRATASKLYITNYV